MSSKRLLPIADVPWYEQFRLLGVEVPNRALPAIVPCPLCRKEHLYVYYRQTNRGGPLLDCRSCRYQGSLLELSARLWRLSVAETCAKFTALGVPLLPPRHTDEELMNVEYAYRSIKRITDLWNGAMENSVSGRVGEMNRILALNECGPSVATGRRYYETVAKMFGVIGHREVEEAFTSKSRVSSRTKLLPGTRWKNVIVLPRFYRPGEICAFEFVGRNADIFDRVVVPVDSSSKELGLFGLETVLNDTPFGQRVLAVDNALLALRMQKRHMSSSSVPLPIVSWMDAGSRRTTNAWQMFSDRPVVFWLGQPTARFIRQALTVGIDRVRVCNTVPADNRRETVSMFFRRLGSGLDAFESLCSRAIPFAHYFSAWINASTVSEIESLLRSMIRNGIELEEVLPYLPAKARSRIRALGDAGLRSESRSVHIKDYEIVEARGGWYAILRRNGEFDPRGSRLISSVVIRLLSLKEKNYKAELAVGDRKIRVDLPASKQFDRTVHNLCVQYGLDVTIDLPKQLSLAQISLAFSGDMVPQS